MLTEGGLPANVEHLREASNLGISMLQNLAVIASEDELCGDTNGARAGNEEMVRDVTLWRKIIELFGQLFGGN
jgi:hypothetical protein